MRVLGVGGTSSNVGKTALVCLLLEALPGWGALKTSVTKPGGHRHGRRGPSDLCADPARLLEAGSDTERFARAGAARVRWLRADLEALAGAIGPALEAFSGLPGVVVEGNSFAAVCPPDALAVLAHAEIDDVKESAVPLLRSADWIAVQAGRDRSGAARAEILTARYGASGVRLVDLLDPADPGRRDLVREIRTWARSPA